jgi:hypothetical protein
MLLNLVCSFSGCQDIRFFAQEMGRTEDSITSRLAKILRLQYFTSNEELLKLTRAEHRYIIEEEVPMNNHQERDLAYLNAEFRLVVDGRTKDVATDETQAYQKAQALLRNCPTKEVILYQAVKRIVVPMNFAIEPFHKPA